SGKGTFTTEHGRYELKAGDTFLIRPNALISYASDATQPWLYRWVAFRGKESEQLLRLAGFTDGQETFVSEPLAKLTEYYEQIIIAFRDGQPISSIHALGTLLLIMNEYGRNIMKHNSQLSHSRTNEGQLQHQIVHYLSTQYTQ